MSWLASRSGKAGILARLISSPLRLFLMSMLLVLTKSMEAAEQRLSLLQGHPEDVDDRSGDESDNEQEHGRTSKNSTASAQRHAS